MRAVPRADLAVGALAALPVTSLLLTGGNGEIQLLVAGYAAVLVLSFLHSVVGLAFTLLMLFAQMSVFGETLRLHWFDPRALVPPVIAAVAIRALRRRRHPADRRTPAPALHLALPLVALLALASLWWSVNPAGTVFRAVGLLAVAALCTATARTVDIAALTRVLAAFGWALVGACVAARLLVPAVAIEQHRLRGVFENANGLAAFLVVVTPLLLVRLRRLRWPAAALLAAVCVATGSRAGCTALGLELLVLAMAARPAKTRIAGLVVTSAGGLWLLVWGLRTGFFLDSPILLLRDTDSRSEQWAYGLSIFHAHPWTGVGMGSLPPGDIAGFVPEALATVGLAGAAILAVPVLVLAVLAARAQAMFMALVVGAVTDVFFEPWLFSGGSMVCLLFWAVVLHPDATGYTGLVRPRPASSARTRRRFPAAHR
ncbi:O-antigen ligase family protein [Actinoplanes siamensis]|uniref:O-antigen ligase-related domain-containing protein n=1 Tax=Actinoplanes siamensis TaxID=1223317 RepID=A0A919TI00_9ACTN|nr:O-antigen ligase family protein [Actinoplanes siamensis]GIF03802.1 hypothetical protein Asi03nite_13400 [Actinoplanes siamensis]